MTLTAMGVAIVSFGLEGDAVTTVTFYTLALAQLWHVFNMRNWRDTLLRSQVTRNIYVWMAIALCLGILAAAILVPALAGVLRLASLPGDVWLATIALSLVPVVLRELAAAVTRIRRGR